MIGQALFKEYLSKMNKPPQFIILNGEVGSGRSTLIDFITHKFKYQKVICGTSVEEIRNIVSMSYTVKDPTFYIFYNGDDLSVSAKNALLKAVEEPPRDSYFIMRTELGIIDTLKNRAFYYNIQPYSFSELKSYFVKSGQEELFDKYGKICKNIGQIKVFLSSPYKDIIDYCDKIVRCINEVAPGNILNITEKLNLDDEPDKWDNILFINVLEWTLLNYFIKTKQDKYFQAIFRINNVKSLLRINGANKKSIFDNFFIGLKYLL